MGSKYIECHDFPGGDKCKHSTTLTADSEEELLEEVVRHAINVHGCANTEEFRDHVRREFKDGNPPA
ncbi:MAG: hypothetical protein C0617_13040 [Desulfuromonas sp.]|uniref:DUF1059 domain-containing protein n=1 Tax=Desulfuromonas sp. TaxID=892 RepID=UPI000CA9C02F|nr:DUF1059 domain-containing protein [Desulfuromonas sp.]PLX82873.1 MAG: hypothetical protein C0617_13040 [Desulfuromonas sp.]